MGRCCPWSSIARSRLISGERPYELDEAIRRLEAALTDARGDFRVATEIIATTELAYYCGDDPVNLPWLAMGASGLVSVVSHAAASAYAARWNCSPLMVRPGA